VDGLAAEPFLELNPDAVRVGFAEILAHFYSAAAHVDCCSG